MKANKVIETLFEKYVENIGNGDIERELHKISADLDEAIEAGDTDAAIDLTGEYELAALRLGFYAGFKTATDLTMPKA